MDTESDHNPTSSYTTRTSRTAPCVGDNHSAAKVPEMKFAFTSLSLPQASLADLFNAALSYGYDSVELRLDKQHGHGVELATGSGQRASLRRQIKTSGSSVVCLSSSVRLADSANIDANLELGRESITLAGDLGVKLIRVFGGAVPDDVSRNASQACVVNALKTLGDFAVERDVTVCLETHDDWASPQRLASVMSEVQHANVGILWDVWHTGRAGGKGLAESHQILSPWIRHVHVHDGKLRLDRLEFSPMGEGDIDHRELLVLLTAQGYDGTLSGEWIGWEPGNIHLPRERRRLAHYEASLQSESLA